MVETTRVKLVQYALMIRAVPRVAPFHVVAGTSVVLTALVLAADDPALAQTRLRFAAACVAASVAFALDDTAASTLAASPLTLRARRAARAMVAVGFASAVFAVMCWLADARSGVGRPAGSFLVEFAAVACVSLAAAAVVVRRIDDSGGGIAGALVAIVCHSTAYLPARWWWPFTADPQSGRLLLLGAGALLVAAAASADPAGTPRDRLTRREP